MFFSDDLDRNTFSQWLGKLNDCARAAGFKGRYLTEITGQLCWYSYYDKGISPAEALKIAQKDGEMFGLEYMEND